MTTSCAHPGEDMSPDQPGPGPLAIGFAALAGFGASVVGAGSLSLYCELEEKVTGLEAVICDAAPGVPILLAVLAPIAVVAAGTQARRRRDPFLFHFVWVSIALT